MVSKIEPVNILVIHFGQLGDVILGLSAMQAVCQRYPDARKTVILGLATAKVVEPAELFDEIITVDRVGLSKRPKIGAVIEIVKLAFSIHQRRFDLVIDLHSLPETNLLGFFFWCRTKTFRQSREPFARPACKLFSGSAKRGQDDIGC